MKNPNYSLISKYRTEVMGLAAIMIMLFHINYANDFSRLGRFGYIQRYLNSGVDMFLLVSALGCYYSYSRKPDIKTFIIKRFATILPVSGALIILFYLFEVTLGIQTFSEAVKQIFKFAGNPAWYISFTLVMYLLFPLIFNLLERRGDVAVYIGIVVVIVINFLLCSFMNSYFHIYEAGLTRVPVFMFGCICGEYALHDKRIRFPLISTVYCAFYLFCGSFIPHLYQKMCLRYFGTCLAILIIYVFVLFMDFANKTSFGKLVSKVLVFFGSMSLETYMTHNLIKEFPIYYKTLTIAMYCGILILSISISIPMSHVRKKIANSIVNRALQERL